LRPRFVALIATGSAILGGAIGASIVLGFRSTFSMITGAAVLVAIAIGAAGSFIYRMEAR